MIQGGHGYWIENKHIHSFVGINPWVILLNHDWLFQTSNVQTFQ